MQVLGIKVTLLDSSRSEMKTCFLPALVDLDWSSEF
jgi:hypothetical protein